MKMPTRDVEEYEANLFARSLLVPEEWIREDVARLGKGRILNEMADVNLISALADRYDVEVLHMTIRLIELGLLR